MSVARHLQPNQEQQPDNIVEGLQPSDTVEVKYNTGTWHIFTSSRARKCQGMIEIHCVENGHRHGNYSRNHCTKTRTVSDVLENPDHGLGETSKTGLNKLQRLTQVNPP